MPIEAPLTPQALRRASRDCAEKSYDVAAAGLNEDWGTTWDGRDLQRWALKVGARLEAERAGEVLAYQCGHLPPPPANAPKLLVIGVDGGRVQLVDADPETGSRWREDKVATFTTYDPGDNKDLAPRPLVTTHVASMEKTEAFGPIAQVEGSRRAWRYAQQVLAIADCGNWIDPLLEREFPGVIRIADWSHAAEHLHACGRAIHGADTPAASVLSEHWVSLLWEGHVAELLPELQAQARRLGAPRKSDGPEHPRRVLSQNVGYFEKNQAHMNYPEYRRKGWPIGSGNVEAGVKQFNKRVKGTEQFWQPSGVEAMLCLRALLLSQDGRWRRYWAARPAYLRKAA